MRLIRFLIECGDCHVSTPKGFELEMQMNKNGEIETCKDEREAATELWNRRCCDDN